MFESINGPTMAAANVAISVSLILINKIIFSNYEFSFPILLTFFHFASTMIACQVAHRKGFIEDRAVPQKELIIYTCLRVGSVLFMNYNLILNNVGFYQLSKLLLTPTTILFQVCAFSEKFTADTYMSLTVISIGIGIVQVSDPTVNYWGTIAAAVGVLSTAGVGLYQKYRVRPFGLNALELMLKQTPYETTLLLILAPMLEDTNKLMETKIDGLLIGLILCTCLLAIGVTVTSFITVIKLSPVTYQVCGHLKTVLLLVGNIVILQSDLLTFEMWLGLILAAGGIAWYMKVEIRIKAEAAAKQVASQVQEAAKNASASDVEEGVVDRLLYNKN